MTTQWWKHQKTVRYTQDMHKQQLAALSSSLTIGSTLDSQSFFGSRSKGNGLIDDEKSGKQGQELVHFGWFKREGQLFVQYEVQYSRKSREQR